MILGVQNPVPDLAETIAQRSLAGRGAAYAAEVRRLLDAGLELMRQAGTESRPRVADIVAAAGLSNDAFYRHFPSKDAFVAALLEDGTQRLRSYLSHQMAKADAPEDQVRRWVEGVMAQAGDPEVAASTKAVLWNGRSATDHLALAGPSTLLATLLEEPLAALGREDPALDAALIGHAVVGRMSEHLSHGIRPTRAEVARIVEFCVAR
jgi:AcrR family transcriptional regulator